MQGKGNLAEIESRTYTYTMKSGLETIFPIDSIDHGKLFGTANFAARPPLAYQSFVMLRSIRKLRGYGRIEWSTFGSIGSGPEIQDKCRRGWKIHRPEGLLLNKLGDDKAQLAFENQKRKEIWQ